MTERKRWPNHAAWARDDAAIEISAAIQLLRPLLDHNDPVVVARAAKSLDRLHRGRTKLVQAGADIEEDISRFHE